MSRKKRSKKQSEIEYLKALLDNNQKAIEEGPKRKKWSIHDLKSIKPLTPAQEDFFHAWMNGYNICAHGTAGTGKSFLSMYVALTEVLNKNQQKIIIVRSAVPTREIGFLPGDLEEKIAMYELPYHDIFAELLGRKASYQDMKDAGVVEFMTTSFIRGLTWDNAIVVVEEGENMTFHEINSIMTRIGDNSRVIFNGDIKQTDLNGKKNGKSGMSTFLQVIKEIKNFASIEFTIHDIVRSDFVKSWIAAVEQTGADKELHHK